MDSMRSWDYDPCMLKISWIRRTVVRTAGVATLMALAACSQVLSLRLSEQIRRAEFPGLGESSDNVEIRVMSADEFAQIEPIEIRLTPVPPGAVRIPATVIEVDLAWLETISIAAEKSKARFRIASEASIPGNPSVEIIEVWYHDKLEQSPFALDQEVIFRFTQDGQFFDIEGIGFGGRAIAPNEAQPE